MASIWGGWQEIWSGSTPTNKELKVINLDGTIKLTSGGYTQSKKIDNNWREGYWSWQANYFDLSKFPKPKVLILGFGGGTIASFLKEKYPNIKIDGVDIDDQVIKLGKTYLGLNEKGLSIHIGDAFDFLKKTDQKYHLIVVDLYIEGVVVNYLRNEEFFLTIKKTLEEGGAVTINRILKLDRTIIDPLATGKQEYKNFVRMLERVFSKVEVLEVPSVLSAKNYIFKGVN